MNIQLKLGFGRVFRCPPVAVLRNKNQFVAYRGEGEAGYWPRPYFSMTTVETNNTEVTGVLTIIPGGKGQGRNGPSPG